MTLAIGVDVGGTKVSAGLVDEQGNLLSHARRQSPAHETSAMVDLIDELVAELASGREVASVGIGAAGFIDRNRSTVLYGANLSWVEEPLRELTSNKLGLPVVVENDANMAAWAEYEFGAGRGARSLLMATIGTGIGGGIVVDGELMRGGFGGAAEIGHIRAIPDGRQCPCGNLGCWETYASGTALAHNARERATLDPGAAAMLLSLAGGDAAAITGSMVSQAASRMDPVALDLFDELGRWIGEGLASLAAVLDPDVIIVGGGVSESEDLSMARIEKAFGSQLTGVAHRPKAAIRRGKLGNAAGVIGAAALSRR